MKILKADELFSKFPNAFDTVSDDVKEKLLKYLETKVIHTQKKLGKCIDCQLHYRRLSGFTEE